MQVATTMTVAMTVALVVVVATDMVVDMAMDVTMAVVVIVHGLWLCPRPCVGACVCALLHTHWVAT